MTPEQHDTFSALRADLTDRSLETVNRAAKKIVDLGLTGLEEELIGAFLRLLKEPPKKDPGCRTKVALMRALLTQDHKDAEVYLRALSYRPSSVSSRASKGARADGSGELRGLAAMGLAGSHYPHAAEAAVDLLAEDDAQTRILAIRALAMRAEDLPIRLQAQRAGEAPSVLAECLESLLALNGARAVPFVASYLEGSAELAELAAFALGSSRLTEAFEPLKSLFDGLFDQRTRLIAMATLRNPESTAFLEDLVRRGTDDIEALRPFGFLEKAPEMGAFSLGSGRVQ